MATYIIHCSSTLPLAISSASRRGAIARCCSAASKAFWSVSSCCFIAAAVVVEFDITTGDSGDSGDDGAGDDAERYVCARVPTCIFLNWEVRGGEGRGGREGRREGGRAYGNGGLGRRNGVPGRR